MQQSTQANITSKQCKFRYWGNWAGTAKCKFENIISSCTRYTRL